MYHFGVCDISFSPSGYPINSIFQCQYVFKMILMEHFSSNYQNAYGHQTFQGGDLWRGALTQIKYISPPAEDVLA